MKMKKRKILRHAKWIVWVALLGAALFGMYQGMEKMNQNQKAESLKQMENSIRKATMTCYAAEGVYPPTIRYLKDNYGVQIDEDRFTVFYEIFGDNMMPEITVMEKQ